jgi:hypothetical protein
MKKVIYGLWVLPVLLSLLPVFGEIPEARAGVQVNINVGPPPVVVAEPPEVVLIPGSQVYFVPEPDIDIFFYNGFWWSPRGDRWYRARAYNGPWVIEERRLVPAPVIRVPRNYRVIYERAHHIPYGQWKKEWEHRGRGERKEMKEQGKRERKEWKEERREERGEPGEGHGRGRD